MDVHRVGPWGLAPPHARGAPRERWVHQNERGPQRARKKRAQVVGIYAEGGPPTGISPLDGLLLKDLRREPLAEDSRSQGTDFVADEARPSLEAPEKKAPSARARLQENLSLVFLP